MKKPYAIVLKRSVLKDIRRIPQSVLSLIQDRVAALATNPFPPGAEPMYGYDHFYRLRIGSYRVVYEVAATIRVITIVKIGHRKDVYRQV